mmetsp:Transcript_4007/g.14904  ORF Transcript_4007/g.14904 Transcript_4007/m.14904 type:complete len:137 (+) Transcript_4007:867-1277(+)
MVSRGWPISGDDSPKMMPQPVPRISSRHVEPSPASWPDAILAAADHRAPRLSAEPRARRPSPASPSPSRRAATVGSGDGDGDGVDDGADDGADDGGAGAGARRERLLIVVLGADGSRERFTDTSRVAQYALAKLGM